MKIVSWITTNYKYYLIMKGKYFISAFYSGINTPMECFHPTSLTFNDISSCVGWIRKHRKYFASSVHFGICNFENEF